MGAPTRVEERQPSVLDALAATGTPDDETSSRELRGTAPAAPDVCHEFAARLPDDYLVYSAGDLGFRPGDRNDGTPAPVDVELNGVPQGVVLALGAEGPILWRVQQDAADHVVGVILSGRHHGEITGVAANVPVLHAAYDDHAPCGSFQINARAPQGANGFVSRLLVHAVDANYVLGDGRLAMGAEVPTPDASAATSRPTIFYADYSNPGGDRSFNVTYQVKARCRDAQDGCVVHCGNELAGDPAFGQPKKCRFEYACGAGPRQSASVQEGQDIRVSCQ
jgi:hypothetical protein